MAWSVHTNYLAPVAFAPIQLLHTSHFYTNHLGARESPRCCPLAVLGECLPLGAGGRSCLVGHFKQEVRLEMVANFLRHHENGGAESHRCPHSLLFSRLNCPNSLSFSSQDRCSSSWIIFVTLWTRSNSRFLVLRAPELDAGLQVGSHQSEAEGQNHLPWPAGHASLDADQDTIGFLGCECTLVAHI